MSDFKNYCDFSKSEQRGVIALLIVIVVLMIIRTGIPVYKSANQQNGQDSLTTALFAKLDSNISSLPFSDSTEAFTEKSITQSNIKVNLSPFDPNTTDEAELRSLGFKESQVKNIVNYKNKGGKFFQKEDLKKLYTIKESDYERVKLYVSIASNAKSATNSAKKSNDLFPKRVNTEAIVVDINLADTNELKQLKGVGSYFAKKIVERREKLGGFVSKSQLLEIWNIDPQILENNVNNLVVDVSKVKKINLNKASVEEFKQHPYFQWKIANALVKMRAQRGKFAAIKEIRNSVLIGDSLYSKIAPYLTLDD